MTIINKVIQVKNPSLKYWRQSVGCFILSADKRIILQQRDNDCDRFPGFLATFGGEIEKNEKPIDTLVRELSEELGAKVIKSDVIELVTITESTSRHQELVYLFFWHDKNNTITGCYEGKAKYYFRPAEVLAHPKIMDDIKWFLPLWKTICYLK